MDPLDLLLEGKSANLQNYYNENHQNDVVA